MLNKPINHVLIIPDGNRRWAKEHGKTLEETYEYALSTVTTRIIEYFLVENNANILSIYIISRKNMKNRNKTHVKPILDNEKKVFEEWINNEKFKKAGIKFKFIGDLKLFPKDYLKTARELEKSTKKHSKKTCNLLAAYDAENELTTIINNIIKQHNKIRNVTSKLKLKTPIDLVIRTGKEKRLSGAPLLQSAYAELFFSNKYYPYLERSELEKIIQNFKSKSRRFGS